jgi:hypothetical protein
VRVPLYDLSSAVSMLARGRYELPIESCQVRVVVRPLHLHAVVMLIVWLAQAEISALGDGAADLNDILRSRLVDQDDAGSLLAAMRRMHIKLTKGGCDILVRDGLVQLKVADYFEMALTLRDTRENWCACFPNICDAVKRTSGTGNDSSAWTLGLAGSCAGSNYWSPRRQRPVPCRAHRCWVLLSSMGT